MTSGRASQTCAAIRRHPRHVCVALLIAGLLLAAERTAAIALAAVVVPAAGLAGVRLRVAIAGAALVLLGSLAGTARLAAIDRSPLSTELGHTVVVRGFLVRRERPTPAGQRARLRVTALGRRDGRFRDEADLVQIQLARGVAMPGFHVGDEAQVSGVLERPVSRPGADFDYAAYLRRNGVHALVRADHVELTGRRRGGLNGLVDALRRRAEAGVGAGLDEPVAALARGLILGQDERIPGAVSEQFKASGLAHLLAVSGQNVALLAILAVAVLGALGLGRRARLIGALGLIAVYVPLTGAGPSILRAGAMGAAGVVAALAGRPGSRWYGVLLATAFTLALDPRAWLDAGWQLSFAAVVGIFWLAAPLGRLGRRAGLPEPVALAIAVTLAATLATAPLIAFDFRRVSAVGLLANLLALPAVAPVMWLGMLAALVAQLSLAPAALLNALNGFALAYIAEIARWSAGLPHAVLAVRLGSPLALGAAYAVPAALVLVLARALGGRTPSATARRWRLGVGAALLAGLAAAAVVLWSGRSGPSRMAGRFGVTFLDVGQGDATLIQSRAGAALVDGGPARTGLVGKLRAAGVNSLALAVLTHPQADHEDGLEAVLRSMPVRVLLDGGYGAPVRAHRRIVTLARRRGTHVIGGRAGQVLRVGPLRIRVLSPERVYGSGEGEVNDRALVLVASLGSFDVFLPADAESNVTGALPLPRVEVAKIAHHGSADPGLGDLLERLRPQVAVIEVGAGNPYGHPAEPTLRTIATHVPHMHRTDRDGDVRIGLDGSGVAVSTGR